MGVQVYVLLIYLLRILHQIFLVILSGIMITTRLPSFVKFGDIFWKFIGWINLPIPPANVHTRRPQDRTYTEVYFIRFRLSYFGDTLYA